MNRELAAKYGLTPRDVSEVFSFTLGGQRLRKYNAGDKEVDLILTMAREDVSKLDDLKSFVLTGYTWSFGERIQRQDAQTQQMLVNYLLALLLVYIVMASQFESLAIPSLGYAFSALRGGGTQPRGKNSRAGAGPPMSKFLSSLALEELQ